jgi:hypothetical protein
MLLARTYADDSTEVIALDKALVQFLKDNFTPWKPSDEEEDEDTEMEDEEDAY